METPAQKQASLMAALLECIDQLKEENQSLRGQLEEQCQTEAYLRRLLFLTLQHSPQRPALPAPHQIEEGMATDAEYIHDLGIPGKPLVTNDWTPGRRLDGTIPLLQTPHGCYSPETCAESDPEVPVRRRWRLRRSADP